jgi:MOSC domain-containing protein YiiM
MDNLAGDRQADLVNHGGKDKAICVYPLAHYRSWAQKFGLELRPGAFGENFSVDVVESQVCLGDIFVIGELRVEVAQPRRPCWKVCRRWEIPELAKEMLRTGRTGWYLRVLRPGNVHRGAKAILEERPYPKWTVEEAHHVRYNVRDAPERFRALATCSALPDGWRSKLTRKAELALTQ